MSFRPSHWCTLSWLLYNQQIKWFKVLFGKASNSFSLLLQCSEKRKTEKRASFTYLLLVHLKERRKSSCEYDRCRWTQSYLSPDKEDLNYLSGCSVIDQRVQIIWFISLICLQVVDSLNGWPLFLWPWASTGTDMSGAAGQQHAGDSMIAFVDRSKISQHVNHIMGGLHTSTCFSVWEKTINALRSQLEPSASPSEKSKISQLTKQGDRMLWQLQNLQGEYGYTSAGSCWHVQDAGGQQEWRITKTHWQVKNIRAFCLVQNLHKESNHWFWGVQLRPFTMS